MYKAKISIPEKLNPTCRIKLFWLCFNNAAILHYSGIIRRNTGTKLSVDAPGAYWWHLYNLNPENPRIIPYEESLKQPQHLIKIVNLTSAKSCDNKAS